MQLFICMIEFPVSYDNRSNNNELMKLYFSYAIICMVGFALNCTLTIINLILLKKKKKKKKSLIALFF